MGHYFYRPFLNYEKNIIVRYWIQSGRIWTHCGSTYQVLEVAPEERDVSNKERTKYDLRALLERNILQTK